MKRHNLNDRATALRMALTAAVLAIAVSAFASTPAVAVYSHNVVDSTFSAGPECSIGDLAVDEVNEWVYVWCGGEIRRFNFDGTPANFSVFKPYIDENAIVGDPGGQDEDFSGGAQTKLAVDNSNSVNQGRLFVTNSPNADIFNPSGEFFVAILQPVENTIDNFLGGLDVGPDGSIYVGSERPGDRVSKYNPALQEVKRFYGSSYSVGYGEPCGVRVDSTGAIWLNHCVGGGGFPPAPTSTRLSKYEADQFTDELDIPSWNSTAEEIEPYVAKSSPFVTPDPLITSFCEPFCTPSITRFDVDLATDDLYVDRGDKIEIYSQGVQGESSYLKAPTFGSGPLSNSQSVAVDEAHRVFATSGSNQIVIFGPGDILPDLHTFVPQDEDVGHTTAHVSGEIELAGGSNITSCEFQYGLNPLYGGPGSGVKTCTPDPNASPPGSNFSVDAPVSADLAGLETGQTYHVRLVASNAKGKNVGIDRTFVPAYVLKVKTLPAVEVDTDGAVLKGSFDPDGQETHYRFEYGPTSSYGFSTPVALGGTAPGQIDVGTTLSGLPSGKTFHYRIVASTSEGTTAGPDRAFRVGSTPEVLGTRATDVAETSVVLRAGINPVGFGTTYKFEYGITPEYGQSIPGNVADIGSGDEAVDVAQQVTGLQAGVTYHFRIVAENKWGVSRSPDTTFDYAPPGCPNDHVRQQSGSSYLPDCRAYELVSPGSAGAVVLFPSNQAQIVNGPGNEGGGNFYNETVKYPLNRGFAVGPSRFTFFGGWGTISGLKAPISQLDMYMSTRTANGWVTTVPGLAGNEAAETGRKECSESMALCTDHSDGDVAEFHREGAPYLFKSDGGKLGRLPTNVDVIPGGTRFNGAQRMSGDFSHFIFASSELGSTPGIPFAPGAQTTGVGSAYDNDIARRTVTLISKLPNGDPIPTDAPTPKRSIDFPGLSPNGSHVLMQTPAGGKLRHLYMRVNAMVTYEIANGIGVEALGMTRNGAEVLYTTTASLSPADTDTSADIYRWSESGKANTLLTGGPTPGAGEPGYSDTCNSTLGPGCDARPLTPERAFPNVNTAISVPSAQDDLFAEVSGDVYFYSPENLDPKKPGIPNQRNLYIYRNGDVHLLDTLDAGTQVTRVQISPDGSHAALITKSRMSPYDNRGIAQMYTYDADKGDIQCVSCNPSGAAPVADVMASQSGRFMADDGRAFFATRDALVPRDQNGTIIDVYEYVGGRPQLITAGLGSRDSTGGAETVNLFNSAQLTGLEAVSRDGTDVYFSTFDTLVTSDHNGQFVKFYSARTGGGFDESPKLAPCAAADECHGVDSSRPGPAVIASGKAAPGGNAQPVTTKKGKKKSKKHKKRQQKKHKSRHARQNRG